MADTEEMPSHREAVEPGPESSDPRYLAWRKRKIEAALKSAETASPVPDHLVWRRLGIED